MESTIHISPKEFRKSIYRRFVVVADIGGTNTRVAILGVRTPTEFEIIFKRKYFTSQIRTIEALLNETLEQAKSQYDIETDTACIGAAGPVNRKEHTTYVRFTNTDLEIDTEAIIPRTLLKKIVLINDFEAIGYGLDFIDPSRDVLRIDSLPTNTAINPTGTMAVIGAGTGLGIGIVPYNKEIHLHIPFPSEGGHADFIPYDLLELELAHYLKVKVMTKKNAHPEIERVLSGNGISIIYDFLSTKNRATSFSKKIGAMDGDEKIKIISENCNSDTICKKTIEMFIKFYARAARNLVVQTEPFSGLFIAGGIAHKHPEWIKSDIFLQEFFRQDRRLDLLQNTPLFLITNTDISLYGCCNFVVNFS